MGTISVLISIAAVFISVLAWHKSRAIYEVRSVDDKKGNGEVNQMLASGEWTILHVKQDASNVLRTIYVLGRIKK